jgi:translation initiation factor eIF-2B subunit alpha
VAAESYKFARMFPLYQVPQPLFGKLATRLILMTSPAPQTDLPEMKKEQRPWKELETSATPLPDSVEVDNPSQDYTPPNLISLLFTDLGVLTPSAVSDELIKLHY